MRGLLSLTLALLMPNALAQVVGPSSSLEAYKFAKELNWADANAAALRATKAQPHDAEAWLILGVTEERLEHLSAAVSAYESYLALKPAPEAAKAVQNKLPELKARARVQSQDIYGHMSSGFFVEKALSYKPAFLSEVNDDMSPPFGLGFNYGRGFFGYRRATGTFAGTIKAPSISSGPVTYTSIPGGGSVTHQEMFFAFRASLINPYTSWGLMQLELPLVFGGYMNTLQPNNGDKKYGNIGYDLAGGLALRGYTRTTFNWYVQGIYHMGIPFWGIREGGSDKPIRNSRDEDVAGNIGGFEFTVGVSLLFGSEISKHY